MKEEPSEIISSGSHNDEQRSVASLNIRLPLESTVYTVITVCTGYTVLTVITVRTVRTVERDRNNG